MDYFFIFIVLYVIFVILNILCFILYFSYKIFKHIFSFISNNKTEKVNESNNNHKIVSKIVNSFISEVYNSKMLNEIRSLYYSNIFAPTNERYMMYTAATNIINDFKIIPFLFFSDVNKYSFNMKKMYIFYDNFENTINEYIKNNKDQYIEKGIVSNNLRETIRKCIEINYINQYHSSNPVFYHHFFNSLVYYFQTF